MFSKELKKLIEIDARRETAIGDRRCLIHRDHRWVLVLLHWAQELGLMPQPCDLDLFDARHASLPPASAARLDRIRAEGLSAELLFDVCTVPERHDYTEHLSALDDDWVQAA
ncbi:MAG TPA: hypothetical protein VKE70_28820 [Candidatus Solibacter sp.]|nr:hypothetical protein [Candidatus Solibacter sp.]